MIAHDGHPLFDGIPSPVEVMRYHSLIVAPDSLPRELQTIAWSSDREPGREIMALAHRSYPVYGVQFHPESVATIEGKRLLANFLELTRRRVRSGQPATV
jgi:anthranilate/para-aminobenzoate synthase component II